MKNSEIHKGLEKKEIRDLIGELLGQRFQTKEREPLAFDENNPFDDDIHQIKYDIIYYQNYLKHMEKKKAAYNLMKHLNLERYDVSDYVAKDLPCYMLFIGTEEEYNDLIKNFQTQ